MRGRSFVRTRVSPVSEIGDGELAVRVEARDVVSRRNARGAARRDAPVHFAARSIRGRTFRARRRRRAGRRERNVGGGSIRGRARAHATCSEARVPSDRVGRRGRVARAKRRVCAVRLGTWVRLGVAEARFLESVLRLAERPPERDEPEVVRLGAIATHDARARASARTRAQRTRRPRRRAKGTCRPRASSATSPLGPSAHAKAHVSGDFRTCRGRPCSNAPCTRCSRR